VFEIGPSLAAARQTRGLELPDVEALTRIRANQLAALERERFDQLPGHAYARAFLRTYAAALDLDAELYVAEFEARFPEEPHDHAPLIARSRRRRRPPIPLLALLASGAAIAAIAAWGGVGGAKHSALSQVPTGAAAPVHRTTRANPPARPEKAKPASRPRLVIRAARGNSWLLVRRGGANGPVLWEGTLTHGSVARFVAPRVWIRLGAPSVVDISRGDKHLGRLPLNPTNVVF
jgi:helix-turn-helix protein